MLICSMFKGAKLWILLAFLLITACKDNDDHLVIYEPEGPLVLMDDGLLNENSPKYQCVLKRQRHGSHSICSGSFIAENLFVTAAHCVDFEDLVASPQNTSPYEIQCFDQVKATVKSLHVHPYYYKRDTWPVDRHEPYSPSFGFRLTNPYNDLAVLVTNETLNFEKFPNLPENNFLTSEYEENSCRFLGFSSDFCDIRTGQGCYREGFSIDRNENIMESSCNLVTGLGCQTDEDSFNFSEESSLLFDLSNLDPGEGRGFSGGDSGAGVHCTLNDEEVLAGVFVQLGGNEVVNLSKKTDFLNQFTSRPFETRHEVFSGLVVDGDYLRMSEDFYIFEEFFLRLQRFMYFPTSETEFLHSRTPPAEFVETYNSLKDWIEQEEEESFNLFRFNKIVTISYTASPGTILSPNTEHPNVRLIDVFNREEFKILEVNSLLRVEELRVFLNELIEEQVLRSEEEDS